MVARSPFKASLCFLFTMINFSLSACTTQRPQVFTQGQGTNLDLVSAWANKTIALKTGAVIGSTSTTHAEDSVIISPKVKAMNHFDLVQISVADTALAGLLGNPPFRGLPNTTDVYQLKIKLTGNYLKFYKVGKPEDLPFEERAYLEETLPDGRIAIPMLGYKISGYFRVEPAKTTDDLNSNHLTEISEPDPTKATHVRIDWTSRELFTVVQTSDLIPAEIFFSQNKDKGGFKPYEWYYAETVMEKSLNDTGTIVGEVGSQSENSQLIPAAKVIIVPRETELRVVNLAKDERLSRDQLENGDLNSEAALIIPVKWSDYRTKTDGVNLSLQGEVVDDRKWDQCSNLQMDIGSVKSAEINEGDTRLLDMEVDQNYFSFTVINMVGNQGRKIHYSFLRADQGRIPYTPKQSFKSDRNVFGFFSTQKPFIANWEYYTDNDFNKRDFLSRMNPDAKEIVFHLSAGSPAWLEDIAARAVAAWNNTFQEAMKGSGKEIKISFSKDRVQVGDLRYNVIHLVESLNEDGLLGYGPSVADPETGEIIAATTNVYVNSTLAIAVSTVRQFIIDRLEKRMSKGDKNCTPQAITVDSATPGPLSAEASEVISSIAKTAPIITKKSLKHQCRFEEQAMMNANDCDILNYCPEIEQMIDQHSSLDLMSRGVADDHWEKVWADAKPAILECSTKLTRGKLLSTLIHEIGHNFGLRHNFFGSYDKLNFKTESTIFGAKITAHSSSIMEYTDWSEDRLTEAGPYDVAAIRFGYGDQVEAKDGKTVKVDVTKSLDPRTLKPYLFCSDEVAYSGLNAFCKTNDAGTTPIEVTQFYIDRYRRTEALREFRRVKQSTADAASIADINLSQTFVPLKDIYDEWRYELGEYVRKSHRYLSDYTTKDYPGVLDAMAKDPQYGPVYAKYHEAAEMIYAFFKDVAFGMNQYCLIDDHGEKRAIELERLRDLLSEASRGAIAIRTCADASDASDLAAVLDADAPKVLGEVGYPINSYRFEKSESLEDNLRNDVIGNRPTRFYAGYLINHRMLNTRNTLNQFAPNMTDEPTYYADFATTLRKRLIDGVDLSAQGVPQAQPLFAQEAVLLTELASTFRLGLSTPAEHLGEVNQVVTLKKLEPFTAYRPARNDNFSKLATTLTLSGRSMFVAEYQTNSFTYDLINRFSAIDLRLGVKAVSEKDEQDLLTALSALFPIAVDLSKATVSDFVNAANGTQKLEVAYGSFFVKCAEVQSPALTQMNDLVKLVVGDYGVALGQGDDQKKKFLAMNLVPYLEQKLNGKPLLFSRENLQPLAAAISSCAKNDVAVELRNVNRYRKDYEAQKSVILDVLNDYAN